MFHVLIRFAILLASLSALPRVASAQMPPAGGPTSEQQEAANVLLLAPEASILGALLVGGGAFLVTRECCTEGKDSDMVDETPVAIGAGIGAAIGATLAVWSISDRYHPGSRRNAAIGGAVGGAMGAAAFFGGPAEGETGNDQLFRLLGFLFAPAVGAYAGWHLDPGAGFYSLGHRPLPTAGKLIGPGGELPGPPVARMLVRF